MTHFNGFTDVGDLLKQYDAPADALNGATLIFAWYEYENYEGYSLVVFRRDGKLFEVTGSHCSCYGLEGQWEPEETTVEALLLRDFPAREELKTALTSG